MQETRFERGRNKVYSASHWYRMGQLDCKAGRDFNNKIIDKDYATGYRDQYAEEQMRNDEDENRTG